MRRVREEVDGRRCGEAEGRRAAAWRAEHAGVGGERAAADDAVAAERVAVTVDF